MAWAGAVTANLYSQGHHQVIGDDALLGNVWDWYCLPEREDLRVTCSLPANALCFVIKFFKLGASCSVLLAFVPRRSPILDLFALWICSAASRPGAPKQLTAPRVARDPIKTRLIVGEELANCLSELSSRAWMPIRIQLECCREAKAFQL